jgi:hypothetical protein
VFQPPHRSEMSREEPRWSVAEALRLYRIISNRMEAPSLLDYEKQ